MANAERGSAKQRALRTRFKVTRRWAGLFLATLILLALLLFPLGVGDDGFRIAMSVIAYLGVATHFIIRRGEKSAGLKPPTRRMRNQVALFLALVIPATVFLFWPQLT